MGIHDRDYYRESTAGWWADRAGRSATFWLIAVTATVFFLQMAGAPRGGGPMASEVTEAGVFLLPKILRGEVWRLITPMFLHADLFHLLFNMYTLYMFGREVEGFYGPREFAAFYLLSGLLVSIGMVAIGLAGFGADVRSLGASGAVMAAVVLFACHHPHRTLYLIVFPVPAWLLAVLFVAADLLGFFGVRGATGIAHSAHLLGAAFGFAYYQQNWRVLSLVGIVSGVYARRRPKLAVYRPPSEVVPAAAPAAGPADPRPPRPPAVSEHLEAELDRVLEKVARSGKPSLTSAETELLLRASEIYKRRRGD